MKPASILFSNIVFIVVCSASFLWAEAPLISNPSFESGSGAPDGWALSGGDGDWLKTGGAEGDRAVTVVNSGTETHQWLSDPVPFAPNTLYRLHFHARREGSPEGFGLAGPGFANLDLHRVPDRWAPQVSTFISPRSIHTEESRIHLGQKRLWGTLSYDALDLHRAQAIHTHKDGLVLGEGETLLGNAYTFAAPFKGESRNYSRPLVEHRCGFNTNRWSFEEGDEVVYAHQVSGHTQKAAALELRLSNPGAGRLIITASAGGREFSRTVGEDSNAMVALPEDFFPAEKVEIRIRAHAPDGSGKVGIQLSNYEYRAALEGPPADFTGSTCFADILSEHPELLVRMENAGAIRPGENRLTCIIGNNTGWTVKILAAASVYKEGRRASNRSHELRIPPGESIHQVPYNLPDAGDSILHLTLGGRHGFSARAALHASDLHRSDYGETLPGSNDKAALWWAASGWKISQDRPAPRARSRAIVLRAARNESEGAQFVLCPKRDLTNVTLTADPLVKSRHAQIPPAAIDILRVRHVRVERPTDRTGVAGLWPDPLPPIKGSLHLEAGVNHAFWVRVKTPRDTAPGLYRGTLRIQADGYATEAALELEVFDFTLPDRMTCETAFGFAHNLAFTYQKVESETDQRIVLDKYLANFSAHHVSPYNPAPLDPFVVKWPAYEPDMAASSFTPEIDWTAWDAAMDRAVNEYHFNTFRLPIAGMGANRVEPEIEGFKEGSPQYDAAFNSYCKQVEDHLREHDLLDEAYVYWYDEPSPEDYEFVMNGFHRLKKAAPGLRRMLTEQVEPHLSGGPDLWCPISFGYDHERAQARREKGERFWWYVCTQPKEPFCTLFIDHPATELRAWLWQTWQRGIDGILIWQTNYWTSGAAYPDPENPQNPYEDPMGWVSAYGRPGQVFRSTWGNGDGRLIYPPESAADAHPAEPVLEGPVDSIRWELLRDGIEDYEYLSMLRRLLAEQGGRLPDRKRTQFESLLEVPADITADMTTFTRSPEPIESRRLAVARAIEELSRNGGQ